MKNYSQAGNFTSEHQSLELWVPHVAVATFICATLALSLVCYLIWLAKPNAEVQEQRERSRSNSSDGGLTPSFHINPLFHHSFKTVLMSGNAGTGRFAPVAGSETASKKTRL